MRIVSYNILDGGEGRADPLAEVIESLRPDVVALAEADNPDVIDRIARRLKMDVAFGQGKKHGAAILSRWRIVESINHGLLQPSLSDCLLEATIVDASGAAMIIGALHLHAHALEADETRREHEIAAVLEVFKGHRTAGKAHVLAGDFNSNSPVQEIEPEKTKPSTRKEWEQNGRHLPRRVIQTLLNAGYLDSLAVVKGVAAGKVGTFSTQFPGQRVDYIFTYGIDADRIRQASVEQDRLAKYASDHFPVFAEIL